MDKTGCDEEHSVLEVTGDDKDSELSEIICEKDTELDRISDDKDNALTIPLYAAPQIFPRQRCYGQFTYLVSRNFRLLLQDGLSCWLWLRCWLWLHCGQLLRHVVCGRLKLHSI